LVLGYIGLAVIVLVAIGAIVGVFVFSDDIERHDIRREARHFVQSAQIQANARSVDVRNADVLRAAYLGSFVDTNTRDVHLADGTPILAATDADWQRNDWRFEVYNDTPAGDVYVCVTIPEGVYDAVPMRNGECLTGS
jgi:hypothetical protein